MRSRFLAQTGFFVILACAGTPTGAAAGGGGGAAASRAAAALQTQAALVARDVAEPHVDAHGDGDGVEMEVEQPGARGGVGNGCAPRYALLGCGIGDGDGGGDGP